MAWSRLAALSAQHRPPPTLTPQILSDTILGPPSIYSDELSPCQEAAAGNVPERSSGNPGTIIMQPKPSLDGKLTFLRY